MLNVFCFLLEKRVDVREEEWEEEEEDWVEEPGRVRRGLKRGTRRRNKKRTIKQKVMSVVALLKTVLSLFTDCSFTVNRWIMDGGCRRQQLRMRTWTGTFM